MPAPRLPRSSTGNVCALDLGTTAGFAIGAFGARPRFGAVLLRGDDAVHRMAALREWLDDQDRLEPISALVLEAAIIGDHRGMSAAEILTSLQAMASLWAYDMEVPVVRVASSTVRKDMIGTGRFPKGEAKDHVVAWLAARGFTVPGKDAADALLTWLAVQQSTLGLEPAAGGMFSKVPA